MGRNKNDGGVRVRRDPGQRVREGVRVGAFKAAGPMFVTFGILVGVVMCGIVGYGIAMSIAMPLMVAVLLFGRWYTKGRFERLTKGAVGERRVGNAIEYAIASEGCAVAHSLTDIAKIGDIDHLVATPDCLWVIETKYRRVPKNKFNQVCRRILANVEAVREWTEGDVEVRGCLVLAIGNLPQRRLYEDERVEVFGPVELIRKLREESRRLASEKSKAVAKLVWERGGMMIK